MTPGSPDCRFSSILIPRKVWARQDQPKCKDTKREGQRSKLRAPTSSLSVEPSSGALCPTVGVLNCLLPASAPLCTPKCLLLPTGITSSCAQLTQFHCPKELPLLPLQPTIVLPCPSPGEKGSVIWWTPSKRRHSSVLYLALLYPFPGAAVTICHKPHGLEKQKFILSQFCRGLKSRSPQSQLPPEGSQRTSSSLAASGGSRHSFLSNRLTPRSACHTGLPLFFLRASPVSLLQGLLSGRLGPT